MWYLKFFATLVLSLLSSTGKYYGDAKNEIWNVKGNLKAQTYIGSDFISKLIDPVCNNMMNKLLERTGWTNMDASSGLSTYCVDLVDLAEKGLIREVVGRENETQQAINILCTGDNPCFVGGAGVGKSAIAENLAIKIAKGEVPEKLANKKIWLLDYAKLKAGNGYSGDFISRVKTLVESLKNGRDNILFFDEVHMMTPIADYFKTAMAKGSGEGGLTMIGATTIDEYNATIAKDPALHRRFTHIFVLESSEKETIEILKGLKEEIGEEFSIVVTDNAINEAVRLSEKYKKAEYFPAKAIKFLRQTAAYCENTGKDTVTERSVREYLSMQIGVPVEELAKS